MRKSLRTRSLRWLLMATVVAMCALPAEAHIGSPDIYAEGQAGPYKLYVTVQPPKVIPGVADIEVRAESPGVERIDAAPMPLTGEAAKHPPVADVMKQPFGDQQYFTGHLWIMASGSWQVRFTVNGSQGPGVLSIPLPAISRGTKKMGMGLALALGALGLLLVAGMVGIIGAAVRESQIAPGGAVPVERRRRAWKAMGLTLALLAIAVFYGNKWWQSSAEDYAAYVYKPLQMTAAVNAGNVLDLQLSDPGWIKSRRIDDFVPDHDHLMHLYAIRWPEMDIVFHLHPEMVGARGFHLPLPDMPAGTYHLYADVVHATGFPETLVATLALPQIAGRPLVGDDAKGTTKPVRASTAEQTRFKLPDGYTMIWDKPTVLKAAQAQEFRFALVDEHGNSPKDMALYMGMLGHAAFVKTDSTVFAHIHPSGTASMAALMMAAQQNGDKTPIGTATDIGAMPGMKMPTDTELPNTVAFPYGFPTAGRYRIIVQMRHGAVVETGIFDTEVE